MHAWLLCMPGQAAALTTGCGACLFCVCRHDCEVRCVHLPNSARLIRLPRSSISTLNCIAALRRAAPTFLELPSPTLASTPKKLIGNKNIHSPLASPLHPSGSRAVAPLRGALRPLAERAAIPADRGGGAGYLLPCLCLFRGALGMLPVQRCATHAACAGLQGTAHGSVGAGCTCG